MHTTAKAFRAWRTFAALTVLTATALLMFRVTAAEPSSPGLSPTP